MITESTIYWITRLDGVHTALTILLAISVVLIICGFVVHSDHSPEDKEAGAVIKFFFISGLILLITGGIAKCFLPTTKEMCAIKVIPMIMNNEKVQTIGNTAYDLAIDWMNELKPKTKKQ